MFRSVLWRSTCLNLLVHERHQGGSSCSTRESTLPSISVQIHHTPCLSTYGITAVHTDLVSGPPIFKVYVFLGLVFIFGVMSISLLVPLPQHRWTQFRSKRSRKRTQILRRLPPHKHCEIELGERYIEGEGVRSRLLTADRSPRPSKLRGAMLPIW